MLTIMVMVSVMVMIIPQNCTYNGDDDVDNNGVDIGDGDDHLCIAPNCPKNDNDDVDNDGDGIGHGDDYSSKLHLP